MIYAQVTDSIGIFSLFTTASVVETKRAATVRQHRAALTKNDLYRRCV